MDSITKNDRSIHFMSKNKPNVQKIKNTLLSVEETNQVSGGHNIPPMWCEPHDGKMKGSWKQLSPCDSSYFRHLSFDNNYSDDPI